MALLQRAIAAVRQGVLCSVRLSPNYAAASAAAAPLSLQFLRNFADASYLDKKDVTDRVLNVVKNFDKVDAGKVSKPRSGRMRLRNYTFIYAKVMLCIAIPSLHRLASFSVWSRSPTGAGPLLPPAGEPHGHLPKRPGPRQPGHCGAGYGTGGGVRHRNP
jgi:hypothetical protein